MFRNSLSSRRLPSPAKSKSTHPYKIMVILALALCTGGLGQTTFVRAAPPADPTVDSWDVSMSPIPSPACAHSHYDLGFFARVQRAVELDGQKVNLQGGFGPANVSVKATSSDPSVAEINPETATATGLDGFIAVSSASFNLNAQAPGSATLTLRGVADWTGLQVVFPPLQQSIKVVNCRFKINITSISAGSIPNISETMVYTLTGEIGGDSKAALTGDAEVKWNPHNATVCFNTTQTVSNSAANFEGSLSEDGGTLTLRVTFGTAMLFSAVQWNCGGAGGAASAPLQLNPPPITVVVPSTGGTVSQPVAMKLGAVSLTGTAIVNVVPIEGK